MGASESSAIFEVNFRDVTIDLRVDDALAPSVLRALAGRTPRDKSVDGLAIPVKPLWLRLSVALLRWYRSTRPESVGQRCVWDPSCSRYAELAFRNLGFSRGLVATVCRLRRCGPSHGGVDVPEKGKSLWSI